MAFLRRNERIPIKGRTANNGVLDETGRARAALSTVVLIDSVTVVVPLVCTVGVPNEQVEPVGSPEQANASDWMNPLLGVTVRVVVAVCPPVTVSAAGDAAMLKSGCEAVTMTEMTADVDAA